MSGMANSFWLRRRPTIGLLKPRLKKVVFWVAAAVRLPILRRTLRWMTSRRQAIPVRKATVCRLPAELYAMAGAMLNTTIKHGSSAAATPAVTDPCTLFAECDLHIPSPGFTAHNTGAAMNGSTTGTLWAATSGSPSSGNYNNGCRVYYASGAVQTSPYYRARGCTVRCIRDTPLETTSLED